MQGLPSKQMWSLVYLGLFRNLESVLRWIRKLLLVMSSLEKTLGYENVTFEHLENSLLETHRLPGDQQWVSSSFPLHLKFSGRGFTEASLHILLNWLARRPQGCSCLLSHSSTGLTDTHAFMMRRLGIKPRLPCSYHSVLASHFPSAPKEYLKLT